MQHIVGYTFATENWCPRHITRVLPTGEGGAFEGWELAPGVKMTTEQNLDEIAAAFGIDRSDEGSFDSSEFPKVITYQMEGADGYSSRCAFDNEPLVEGD